MFPVFNAQGTNRRQVHWCVAALMEEEYRIIVLMYAFLTGQLQIPN